MSCNKKKYHGAEIEIRDMLWSHIVTLSEGTDNPDAGGSAEFDDLWGDN